MSPYTIVLREIDTCCKKKQLESRQRQLEKTAVVKTGAYIVSVDRKTGVYKSGSWWNRVFWKTYTKLSVVTHSHFSLTCLWIRAYIIIIAEPDFIIHYYTVWAPVAHVGVTIWVYTCSWKTTCPDRIASNSNSVFLGSARFHSACLIYKISYEWVDTVTSGWILHCMLDWLKNLVP